ncbi:hypothetical protein GCM10009715_11730 [Paeniglutamicibacter psychrophenolicus]|uniref:Uncharacterized protein n=1 Tax=Paeniglutamicibacter psychrophenolicus TaxID=257454 RepID=A0ABS4W7L4_9MICC|nr:hypothetical protein [Paeniglutamicibacter psychrophenolicus]MBP2372123.1 hypothetical protein [Paeniglutamicibacter psychrophenolicus]
MRFNDVMHILANSTAEDWHYIPCHGGNGPAYAVDWKESEGNFTPNPHPRRATYSADVNLTIAWGLELQEDGEFAWLEEGIPSFIKGKKTTADLECIDVFWAGALIARRHYYAVASEHVWIPAFQHSEGERVILESHVRFLETVSHIEAGDPMNKLYTTRSALERIGVRVDNDIALPLY